jgi:hypothetical protein
MPDFLHALPARQHNLFVWRNEKARAEARALNYWQGRRAPTLPYTL